MTAGSADGSYTTNFADLSTRIFLTSPPSLVTIDCHDVGGATGIRARHCRVLLVP